MAFDADVLVVGAGPVGMTLANELSRYGAKARIIDKANDGDNFRAHGQRGKSVLTRRLRNARAHHRRHRTDGAGTCAPGA